ADAEPTPPSPPPTTTTPPPPQDLTSTSQVVPTPPPSPIAQPSSTPQQQQPSQPTTVSMDLLQYKDVIMEEVDAKKDAKVVENVVDVQGRLEETRAKVYHINLEHPDKVLSMQDDELEPAELQEVIEVVTTAKLMTEVVIAATTTIIAAAPITAARITVTPTTARRRKRVVIRDPEETATPSTIIHSEPKSKEKGKGIMVEKRKPLKKQAQIEQDEAYEIELEAELNKNINWDDVIEQNMVGFKMDYFKGMSYDDIRLIFKKYFNSNVAFLEKSKEQLEEEESRALKRKRESLEEKAAKKRKLDEEVEEMKKHLQIVPNDNDDVYTEATPLALKVLVVDCELYSENNKPFYKIIRANGSHQLFLSFINLLRNFDREDLEMLWQIVQETFASSKPKNFSDDFLLTTLTYMFEKPGVEAQVWNNQRSVQVPNDNDDVYTEATPLALKPGVEAKVWNNQRSVQDDLAGREKIFINKVYFGSDDEQCKTTAKVKKVDDEVRIQALVNGKRVNIKESSIRRTLRDDILREKLLNVNLLIAKIEALNANPTPSFDCKTKSPSTSLNSLLKETNTFDNSLPEFETFCFDVEEISSGSTTTYPDISLPKYEAFYDDHVKEISSGSTTTYPDISLPKYEAFYDDHVKEISSGSPTTHFDSSLYTSFIFDLSINPFPPADRSDFYEFTDELIPFISPPEYNCFLFKVEPNSRDFTKDVVEDISPTRKNHKFLILFPPIPPFN
nr:hypothetical protein [Tanacetum cinerariifolium]